MVKKFNVQILSLMFRFIIMTIHNLDLGDGNFCHDNFEILTNDHLRGHGQNLVKPFGHDTRILAKNLPHPTPTPHFQSPVFNISLMKTCPFLDQSFSLFPSRAVKTVFYNSYWNTRCCRLDRICANYFTYLN